LLINSTLSLKVCFITTGIGTTLPLEGTRFYLSLW